MMSIRMLLRIMIVLVLPCAKLHVADSALMIHGTPVMMSTLPF